MSENAMTAEKTCPEKTCLRCGGGRLLSAQLEHPLAFCMDHVTRHGRVHLCMKALLCQECGHIEFWSLEPPLIVEEHEAARVQEEDF